MTFETLHFLAAPIALSVLLVGIHAYLGLHVLERGVIFIDISLAQVAALGAAIGLMVLGEAQGVRSLLFSLGFCLSAALGLAVLRRFERTLSQEAIIGITYAWASGALILVMDRLPHGIEHLKSALVGNILFVTWSEVIQTFIVYILIGVFHYIFRAKFWASSRGQASAFLWDFLFYFLFGVVITFSTQHAGVLVVFSILVAPAAIANRFTTGVRSRLAFAWIFGFVSVLLAFIMSLFWDWPSGPAIVTTVTSLFFISLIGRILYERFSQYSR